MAISKRAILSAGHGGSDPGAVSGGRVERDEAILIVNKTAQLLAQDGRVEVVVIPHSLGLKDGIAWLNARYKNINDAVAIEVHRNSNGGTASGYETWIGTSNDSRALASKLHSKLLEKSGIKDRGMKVHTTNRHGRLGWIADTNVWAFLTECGFIDFDPADVDGYAQGHYEGVLSMFGLSPKVAPPPPAPPTALKVYRDTWVGMDYTYVPKAGAKLYDLVKGSSSVFKGDDFTAFSTFEFNNERYYVTFYSHNKAVKEDYLNGVKESEFIDPVTDQPPKSPPVDDYPKEPREDGDPTKNQGERIERLENIVALLVSALGTVWGAIGSVLNKIKKEKDK